MKDHYSRSQKEKGTGKKRADAVILKNKMRIANAKQMMVDGEISAADYKAIKERYEPEIRDLERQKQGLTTVETNLMQYVAKASQLLQNLPRYYVSAGLAENKS